MADADKKKNIILGSVAVVLLAGAVVAYLVLSAPPAPPPEVSDAERLQQQITDSMNSQPAPQEVQIQRPATRGVQKAPGTP
jgi:hypothetical protein